MVSAVGLLAMALAGCGNLSQVSSAGTTGKPVFPNPDSVTFKTGSWPNMDNLRQVQAGMSKDQLYQLLGTPHFGEGLFGVREWDYLFHFHTGQGERTCQYKILFDKDTLARSFYWKPESCASVLAGAQPESPMVSISSDVLFGFGNAALTPAGIAEIQRVAALLSSRHVATVKVVGHTDRIGGEQANQLLSERRAQAVRAELLKSGFLESEVRASGVGESQPIKQCGDDMARAELIACLAPNRRVEMITG